MATTAVNLKMAFDQLLKMSIVEGVPDNEATYWCCMCPVWCGRIQEVLAYTVK